MKAPRKEYYRVSLTRPAGTTVESVRQALSKCCMNDFGLDAKVELIRASHPDATPKSFWQRLFHAER